MDSVKQNATLLIKGSLFTLTVLQLQNTDMENFAIALANTVKQSPKFFEYAPLVIDIEALQSSKESIDFARLQDLLRKHHIVVVGIRGGNPTQQEQAKQAELAIFPATKNTTISPASHAAESKPQPSTKNSGTKLITQPVRSGQQIYAKGGDLIILASVSHGAEVLADGNIHVYGTLRGRALAGISGDTNTRIFCQQMEAQLISIAGYYLVNETEPTKQEALPGNMTQIYLEDGHLHIKTI